MHHCNIDRGVLTRWDNPMYFRRSLYLPCWHFVPSPHYKKKRRICFVKKIDRVEVFPASSRIVVKKTGCLFPSSLSKFPLPLRGEPALV